MSVDLRARYLGMELCSPVVASAGPVTGNPAHWEALVEAGVGAVVRPGVCPGTATMPARDVEDV